METLAGGCEFIKIDNKTCITWPNRIQAINNWYTNMRLKEWSVPPPRTQTENQMGTIQETSYKSQRTHQQQKMHNLQTKPQLLI